MCSVESFEKHLKTYLFGQAFNKQYDLEAFICDIWRCLYSRYFNLFCFDINL